MPNKEISEALDMLFRQAQVQFGSAIKSRWFHDEEGCPGCGGKLGAMKFKKKKAVSLNAFIFREHGVLIGYLLCGKCANQVFRDIEKDPHAVTTPLHEKIEVSLKKAYVKHLGH